MSDVLKVDAPKSFSTSTLGVWVGISNGSAFTTTRWATWSARQSHKMLVGDFNGDQRTDLMKFDVDPYETGTGGLWVGLSDGVRFNTSQWASWTTSPQMRVFAADVNCDGRTDVAKIDVAGYDYADLGIWVGVSNGQRFQTGDSWARWQTSRRMQALMGDFDGDCRDDLMKIDVH
jgi:hypothetical protein